MQHAKSLILFLALSGCSTIAPPIKEEPLHVTACVFDVMLGGAHCSKRLGPEYFKEDMRVVPYIDMNNYTCFPPSDIEAILRKIRR